MGKYTMNVTVKQTNNNGDACTYEVEVEESAQKKTGRCLQRYSCKIIAVVVIIATLVFSKCAISDIISAESKPVSDSYILKGDALATTQSDDNEATSDADRSYSLSASLTVSKSVLWHQVLRISCFCLLTIVIGVLCAILLKDNSGIRYEKLDMLQPLRDSLLKKIDTNEFSKETVETKSQTATEKETLTKVYSTPDLLKHYMNCITEI